MLILMFVLQIENAPVLGRQGRQEERSEEVPDQVSMGRQNPVLEELDPAARSIGESVADNRLSSQQLKLARYAME